jgi:hypothetical protein
MNRFGLKIVVRILEGRADDLSLCAARDANEKTILRLLLPGNVAGVDGVNELIWPTQ